MTSGERSVTEGYTAPLERRLPHKMKAERRWRAWSTDAERIIEDLVKGPPIIYRGGSELALLSMLSRLAGFVSSLRDCYILFYLPGPGDSTCFQSLVS